MPSPLPAEVRLTPIRHGHRRSRRSRTPVVLAVLGLIALASILLGFVVPSGAAPLHPVRHAAARPAPPPPAHLTVGRAVYACTVVPPRKSARRH